MRITTIKQNSSCKNDKNSKQNNFVCMENRIEAVQNNVRW